MWKCLAFDASASDDPDGDALAYAWALGDGQTANGVTISHTYTTAGLFSAVLTVSDGNGGSDSATRQVIVTSPDNTAPLARDDSYTGTQGRLMAIAAPGILANDTDAQNPAALAVVLVTPPGHGTLTLAGNGAFAYQPEAAFAGKDFFTYTATDGQFQSEPATVTITVTVATVAQDAPAAPSGDSSGCFVKTVLPGSPHSMP